MVVGVVVAVITARCGFPVEVGHEKCERRVYFPPLRFLFS